MHQLDKKYDYHWSTAWFISSVSSVLKEILLLVLGLGSGKITHHREGSSERMWCLKKERNASHTTFLCDFFHLAFRTTDH